VSYPDGWERYWNDCRAAADVAANRLDVDDPAFLRAVAARLHATHGIDPARVRVLGVSNGAHMAFRLALEAPADVQAIAAVAATLPAEDNLDCVPVEQPVPVLVVVGTADRISPYEGGPVTAPDGRPRGAVRSAPGTAEWFARVAGAAAEPLRETVLEPHPVTGIWAERLTWGPARGAEVVLLTVHGGGHVVHGPGLAFPPELGASDPRLDVLEEALRFFERQPPAARRAGAPARPPQRDGGAGPVSDGEP
jgi:polyhydroxybutyrate depolymerase